MPAAVESFIARQPILDRRHRIVGYEIVVSDGARPGPAPHCARTGGIIADAFARLGADALLGPLSGFIRVTAELLQSELVLALPADRVVLEIPPLERVDRAFEERCRELKRGGFRLALRGLERRDPREVLLPVARYVKLDLDTLPLANLRPLVRRVKRSTVSVVAEGVETPERLEESRAADCDFFQGLYFTRPRSGPARSVDPERVVLTELLMKLGQDCDFDEIVETFKRNPALSVGLLRLVNSGTLARATRIKTVPEALVLIGRDHLARWLTVLLYTRGDQTGMEDVQLKVSARRGRAIELLYKELGPGDGINPDMAYLVGMLSLMDVLFGVPMGQLLGQIDVDEPVREALLERRGLAGQLLRLEERFEALAFDEVDALLAELDLDPARYAQVAQEAHAWVHGNESPRFEVGE